ncbi:MAG: hypothetical protein E7595_01000 [Ruminococcaceae bacterium]|nr:hypothetical protein [Oscillospiraceae bacterium]
MRRGFITIATGKEHYYKIAANLLMSYRFFAKERYPFAIIAEEENEYTKLFDDVVITDESTHSFMDKFLLLKLCPYDETIFFDADSLAYGDLNEYWDFFKDATDFSAIGVNVDRHSKYGTWYNVEDIGKYGENLEYKTRVHAGVCFIRKSDSLNKMYQNCKELSDNYSQLRFHSFSASKDECILGVAMPMNNMKAIHEVPHMMAAYPCLTYLKADILHDRLKYKTDWADMTEKGIWLHWGTIQTYEPLYRFNVECLRYRIKYENHSRPFLKKIYYDYKLRYGILQISFSIKKFITRISRKIKRVPKIDHKT